MNVNTQAALIAGLLFGVVSPIHPARAQGGVPLWANIYTGASSSNEAAIAIAIDSSSNVIVTGQEVYNAGGYAQNATIKYSNAGVPLWTNIYRGPFNTDTAYSQASSMAVDDNGNVFITEEAGDVSNSTDAIIKLSGGGALLWEQFFSGSGYNPLPIAVETNGDVIVADTYFSGNDQFRIIKYSSAGAPVWTNYYSGPEDDAVPRRIAVDHGGNIFVMGVAYTATNIANLATVAYSSAGAPLWTNSYRGPSAKGALPAAMAVDATGDVFVTGTTIWTGSSEYFATIKYSNAGVPLWTNLYDGPTDGIYIAQAIAADGKGNVFVTGRSYDGAGSAWGYATIAFSNAGVPLWTNRFTDPTLNDVNSAIPKAIAADRAGNVFVSGHDSSANSIATVAYSNSGAPLWTNRYAPGHVAGVALDGSGNVFVAGSYYTNNSAYAYVTIKYSSSILPTAFLDFQLQYNQLVLNWTNAGFTLQSAPDLAATFTNIPNATSPFTNPFTGVQQFFRLAQ